MKTAVYHAGKLLVRFVFGFVARVHVVGAENANRAGGFLLASNHISHFDPFLIGLQVRRKIDWMTMAEFFRPPALGFFLRSIEAFPAERDRADLRTIRTTIDRLKSGRIVGIFPEGGIRDGARSLLQGAPLRAGAATLAQIADVPVVPCVILGSDRFYSKKQWLPFRRSPLWMAFGKPISSFPELQKSQARKRIESELAADFKNLYAELREKFRLTVDDLPKSPQERTGSRRASAPPAKSATGNRSGCPTIPRRSLGSFGSTIIDSLLCASINWLHRRHPLNAQNRQEMEHYLTACERLSPQEYYVTPKANGSNGGPDSKPAVNGMRDGGMTPLSWRSPIRTAFAANNIARVDLFRTNARNWTEAPTVFLLHALMSSSPAGYYRWAEKFNEFGWNACFVHLPYHFSRAPTGYWNGELAITPDLIRNAEGLRQGVIEVRQIMDSLRGHGCREFGVLATSYGGWVGALLTLVESDFRFVALMSPIVNVEHAIWQSPAARRLRRELVQANVERALVARHFHLSSPLHGRPACDPTRILFVTGDFDSIVPPAEIEAIHQTWQGSELLRVRQGHFGHRMMPETIAHLKQRGDL
ncbi:MAG TPA: 1-acyl-sn-glycerol-3-phosphate acyltransferase [Candidatus Udaeobacter sp.]|nr:1-acyl-sn-glycerol-3-phosphate acyltransferase [Candidatus Udaeobacter sp.]